MQSESPATLPETDPQERIVNALRSDLAGLFEVTSITRQSKAQAIAFGGRFIQDADTSYDELRRRFQIHAHTP